MPTIEEIIEAIGALFLIYIFVAIVVPALGDATNTSTFLFTVALVLIAIGVIFGLFQRR
ncbi:MAG: hypothetical protein HY369_03800 [Candidatus Aenigmarchaeota archaeon]|nr:hypothetical protein [Candidatus Aenigmarchaeota archaeon]